MENRRQPNQGDLEVAGPENRVAGDCAGQPTSTMYIQHGMGSGSSSASATRIKILVAEAGQLRDPSPLAVLSVKTDRSARGLGSLSCPL